MSTTEEERAALWRQQQLTRIAYQRELMLSLRAPPAPRAALMAAWQPLLAAQLEAQVYIDPRDDI